MQDSNINQMNNAALRREVARLRTAIRQHRDQASSHRWMDDYTLYDALPERASVEGIGRILPKGMTHDHALQIYRARRG